MDTHYPYRVVFSGRLQEGFEPDEVKSGLATQLQLSPEKIEAFFSGRKQVLKHATSRAKAERYSYLFNKAGLVTTVEALGKAQHFHDDEAEQAAAPEPGRRRPLPLLKPFRTSWLYRPTLYLVALIEVVWLAAYVTLLPGLLVLLLTPQLFGFWLFEHVGNVFAAAAVYSLTLLLAVPLIALLAKPLLSLRSKGYPTVPLSREHEPDLYDFIDDVCETVDVAPPAEILLSNDATLAVRFHEDIHRGLIKGQTVLVLGLPLLISLNTRQLAAAVAQAMHGWSPRRAPRAARFVERNFEWLHRASSEPDLIDRALQRGLKKATRNAPLLASLQRIIRWSRAPLQLHLRLSRALAGRLYQRRITDADLAARRLAGNVDFRRMLEQSRILGYAALKTIPTLTHMWQTKGELPDNIAMAVVAQASHYPDAIHDQLRSRQERKVAETHALMPSDRQRLIFLDQAQEEGRYRCDSRCATLVRRFEKLMHSITMRYYHKHLGLPVTTNNLIRTPLKGSQEYDANHFIACHFGTLYADFVPLGLHTRLAQLAPQPTSAIGQHWALSMNLIERERAKAKAAMTAYHRTDDDLIAVSNRELMQRAGYGSHFGEIKLLRRQIEAIHETCREYEAKFDTTLEDVTKAATPYVGRLAATLALLGTEGAETRFPGAQRMYNDVKILVSIYGKVEAVYPQLRNLRLQVLLLESLLSYDSSRAKRKLRDLITEKSDDIDRLLRSIDVSLRQARFPFAAKQHYKNLMHWVLSNSLPGDSVTALFDRGTDGMRNLALVQRLIVGHLCNVSLQVEKAFALKAQVA